ncbi:MAG: hypothetical protein A3E21_00260 [Sulfurimonas sp. RIFCSPHIGHO2_12_FULL_36_9]|uniref:EF-hand domain-containing protein n=1 Tax=Sulfurimonas sp. RIFCSPLOWO2_12_36_12 TaxID=1802253 RepID=UPI0008B3060F|nr:EF-hand domain-containing protein [Sulfurimonas sp. RIFCSPLOWO2_12_36_12]OHD98052.1 MAG: hypothetical protein A3J26_02060 [Sulfurimonas sp. RIFCSPLOWO2_02_FULL_36_28]OHD98399.1 MAG: hypothetical protein A3E21_00260 [Sulfurimonas sp. RIFCSPHIGHO2_12_FULL_36_9]OHE01478.1 MAG: hypothetical protein A2W82_02505 [Sulfurimonas sp. RIFCSPLOWO2_12_36_12]OHE08104.1 MAG: hypothetical protein A3K14_00655 [Sulfurimonas sp. RIFCSPLOWO2_12_FULL_36_74]
MEKFTKYMKLTLVTVGLLSIVPVVSSAKDVQRGMGRGVPTFESFDLNSDGHLTESEMKEAREKRVQEKKDEGRMLRNSKDYCEFSKVDSDGDGKVTRDEFKTYQMKKRVN